MLSVLSATAVLATVAFADPSASDASLQPKRHMLRFQQNRMKLDYNGVPYVSFNNQKAYSSVESPKKHEWISTFAGATAYAYASCVEYGSSTIQEQTFTGAKCLKFTQGADCSAFKTAFQQAHPAVASKISVLVGEDGNCNRKSIAEYDNEILPMVCTDADADCIFSDLPVDNPSLATEIFVWYVLLSSFISLKHL